MGEGVDGCGGLGVEVEEGGDMGLGKLSTQPANIVTATLATITNPVTSFLFIFNSNSLYKSVDYEGCE
jgi:hypothetical protein